MNIDLKIHKQVLLQPFCKGSIEPVLRTIEIAAKTTHVEITTMLIDKENSSLEEIRNLSKENRRYK